MQDDGFRESENWLVRDKRTPDSNMIPNNQLSRPNENLHAEVPHHSDRSPGGYARA